MSGMNGMIALTSGDAAIVLEPRVGRAPAWRHWGAAVDTAGLPPLAETRGAASFSFDEDVPLDSAPLGGMGWFGPVAEGTALARQVGTTTGW